MSESETNPRKDPRPGFSDAPYCELKVKGEWKEISLSEALICQLLKELKLGIKVQLVEEIEVEPQFFAGI